MAKIQGEVVSIDAQGNLVTDITEIQLEGVPRDDRVTVTCDGHRTLGIFPLNHQEPKMTLLAYCNADQHLSLALVGDSASKFLGIRPGAAVMIRW